MYINRQPAIIVNRKAQSFVVNAGAPVIIKPAPVVIQRPGTSEYRPYEQTISSPPIIVDKKIIKIDRPIVKKYYHESYSQAESCDCGSQTIPLPIPPVSPPCGSPPRKYSMHNYCFFSPFKLLLNCHLLKINSILFRLAPPPYGPYPAPAPAPVPAPAPLPAPAPVPAPAPTGPCAQAAELNSLLASLPEPPQAPIATAPAALPCGCAGLY